MQTSSLYKLYMNNAMTDAGWKKLVEALRPRLAESKTPGISKTGTIKDLIRELFGTREEVKVAEHIVPCELLWRHEPDKDDIVCWRYWNNKTEEKLCLQWMRKGSQWAKVFRLLPGQSPQRTARKG